MFKIPSVGGGGQNVSKFLKSDAGQITMSVAAAAVAKYGTERITKRLLTNMIYGKPTNLPAIGPRAVKEPAAASSIALPPATDPVKLTKPKDLLRISEAVVG